MVAPLSLSSLVNPGAFPSRSNWLLPFLASRSQYPSLCQSQIPHHRDIFLASIPELCCLLCRFFFPSSALLQIPYPPLECLECKIYKVINGIRCDLKIPKQLLTKQPRRYFWDSSFLGLYFLSQSLIPNPK